MEKRYENYDYDNYTEEKPKRVNIKSISITPMDIKKRLDEKVIGQEHTKMVLALEVYKHMLKLKNERYLDINNKEVSKSNILMTGTTGTGKTYLCQTLAEILDVPFAIVDATTLTEAGYVGDDVENIILKLIQNANGDIKRAERGIIYIDEIDKLSRKSENPSITRDVSGEGVQQALLKILEGTECRVPPQGGRKHPNQECIEINTKNILFIGGGSFEGIECQVKDRLKKDSGKVSIGFNVGSNAISNANKKDVRDLTIKEIRENINVNDIKKFGMLPELLGRFPVLTNLQPLDKDDLVNILKLNSGYIGEYQTMFELMGKTLSFENEALEEIAQISIDDNTGARGLKSIIEKTLMEIMFTAPSEKKKVYKITKDMIKALSNKEAKSA